MQIYAGRKKSPLHISKLNFSPSPLLAIDEKTKNLKKELRNEMIYSGNTVDSTRKKQRKTKRTEKKWKLCTKRRVENKQKTQKLLSSEKLFLFSRLGIFFCLAATILFSALQRHTLYHPKILFLAAIEVDFGAEKP